ncbi:polymorphic toxin-type HINT domain-containing protein [Adhaeretor mobilis]|uniref:polymorphic toxin-type HINT domain-containing protein n=1 Tax=Adhaeretor mobilis TaxID=1930276 RepID=UPI0021BC7136|nr:polymorphic toxin-type HINT domain-containing protein [Adhaeretor mobilis]
MDFGICFAAGTPVLTPDGEKPIEELQVGDRVLARDELNVEGVAEPKVVEKTFRSTAEIVELHVDGQVIRTTGPHRFFAKGKGWISASELQEKDLLSTNQRDWAKVERVVSTGEEERVYNLTVTDHHTYFVGAESWGFAVWAHNWCGDELEFNANRPFHMIIRDNATSAITFMGRIDDPTQLQNSLTPTVVDTNADFDSNQDVDGLDFLALQRGYGIATGAALVDGDSNADGAVDAIDMNTWETQYGQTAQQVAAAAAGGVQEEASQQAVPSSRASYLDAALATQWLDATNERSEGFVVPEAVVEALFATDPQFVAVPLAADAAGENGLARSSSEVDESQSAAWLTDDLLDSLFGGPQNSLV